MNDDATRPPEAAFSLLANETRFDIISALWDARGDSLSFSELRAEVGVEDSGQFNYHLGELVDVFVHETDGGYELRYAGARVIGAVYSGAYTRETTVDPVPVDGNCYDCGGGLEASYRDERARIACGVCDVTITGYGVPPGLLEGYPREDLPYVFDRWIRIQATQFLAEFCPLCLGRMDTSLGAERIDADDHVDVPGITHECQRCGISSHSVVGVVALQHPAVVAFHHDHGIDLRDTPLWELEWLIDERNERVSTDPPQARVYIPLNDEELVLDIDENAAVTDAERRPVSR